MSEFLLKLVANHLVQGCLLALLVGTLLWRWRGLNAASRHNVWLGVLAILILMPALAWLPRPALERTKPLPSTPTAANILLGQVFDADPIVAPSSQAPTSNPPATVRQEKTIDALPVLAGIWLAGAGILLLRLAGMAIRTRRLAVTSRPAPAALQQQLDRMARDAGLTRPVPVRVSDQLSAPVTAGILRYWIALPPHVLEQRGLSDLLRHELAHVVRRDPLVALAQRVACALLFFHPAIWFASRRLDIEREIACDDWAASHVGGARQYAASLVDAAEAAMHRRVALLAVGCLDSRHELRRRVAHLLDRSLDHAPRMRAVAALPMVTVLALVLAAGRAWPEAPRPQATPDTRQTIAGVVIDARHELLHAVWREDLDRVDSLLSAGADVDRVYPVRSSPRTALNAAAMRGNRPIIERLLTAGADVNFHAAGDGPALTEAIRNDQVEAASLLLQHGAAPDARDEGDGSPLIAAAAGGHVELLNELMDQGADPNGAVQGDGSPLIAATRNGHADAIQALLQRGADPNLGVRGDEWPLYHAVRRGDAAATELLIGAGVNVNQRFPGDGTPLMLAVRHGQAHVAELLVAAGAKTDRGSEGDGNPLIEAVRRGDAEWVSALITAGADVNAAVRGDGNALINAARRGRLDLARLLVEAGADVNRHVPNDDTPLINAVRSGNCDLVQYLVNAGADVHGTGDQEGLFEPVRTPLNQADDPAIVAVLEGRGSCS